MRMTSSGGFQTSRSCEPDCYDNAISFFNPGRLYGDLTIEKLKTDSYQSRIRNKLIAEAFYLTRDIEKYGSGYIRIRREIADYPTMKKDGLLARVGGHRFGSWKIKEVVDCKS